jgi:ABC-2 type transport system permease protein
VIALLRSELLRMRSRRLLWVLIAATIAGILVASAILTVRSHKRGAADVALATQIYQEQLRTCLNGDFGVPEDELGGLTLKQWCHRNVTPEQYESVSTQGRFTLDLKGLPDVLLGTSFLMFLIGVLIGASSIGAEFSAGTFTTLLTWEPRRLRVMIARLLIVAITVAVFTLVLQSVLALMISAVAALRGSTAGTGPPWLHHVVATIGRMTLMAAVISFLGFGVAAIGRGTAAALGGLFVYLALFENLLRGLRPSIAPWLLSTNVIAYMTGHPISLEVQSSAPIVVGVARGLAITCLYVGAVVLVAGAVLRVRDVN